MSDLIALKIGRHTYTITTADEFMDNVSCVQLLTQSMEKLDWGYRANPTLSQSAIKEIAKFERIQVPHLNGNKVQVFSLRIK